jgi:hypothetical protein
MTQQMPEGMAQALAAAGKHYFILKSRQALEIFDRSIFQSFFLFILKMQNKIFSLQYVNLR